MTEPIKTPPGALVFDGDENPRADVLAAARAHLIGAGVHHLDVDAMLADRPGLVARAWWGGDDIGFVNETHPGALPVTVVNISAGI